MDKKAIREKLDRVVNTLSFHKDGTITAKKSYFYGIFSSGEEKLADKIVQLLGAKVRVLDMGNHWHPFVGGAKAGTAKDSYFWVKFRVG